MTSPMIFTTPEMFEESNDHWKMLYSNGLQQSTRGLTTLRHENVNPFHVCIPNEKRNEKTQAVYHVRFLDENFYFFENDYKKCFEKYQELNKYGTAELWCACMTKTSDNPKECVDNYDNGDSPYNGTLWKWSDRYNSWML